jgi:hypothetical protein
MSGSLILFSDSSAAKGEKIFVDLDQHEHVEALQTALLRLLKVHVLDVIVFHITI